VKRDVVSATAAGRGGSRSGPHLGAGAAPGPPWMPGGLCWLLSGLGRHQPLSLQADGLRLCFEAKSFTKA